jgi:hypothetical protein
MIVRVSVEARRDIDDPFVWFGVNTVSGIAAYSDANVRTPYPGLRAGERVTYEIATSLQLTTGSYSVQAAIRRSTTPGASLLIARALPQNFYVTGRGFVHGIADLGGDFSVAETG